MSNRSSDLTAWLYNQYYSKLALNFFRNNYLSTDLPDPQSLQSPTENITIELVCHCWEYAYLLRYQLLSLVKYSPKNITINYSLFYCEEDKDTVELIAEFDKINIPSLNWHWRPIPKEHLFRRAIGRQEAAKSTTADWIWFADCDLIFYEGCLESLGESLQGLKRYLVFPDHEYITDILPADHALLQSELVDVDSFYLDKNLFTTNKIEKAKGAFQIVHGDIARAAGYCGSLPFFQKPSERWRKTYEDRLFRKLIGDQGEPVPMKGLHRIRHAEKGRYQKSTMIGKLRKQIHKVAN